MKVLVFTMPDGSLAYTNGGQIQIGGQAPVSSHEINLPDELAHKAIERPVEYEIYHDEKSNWGVRAKNHSQKGKPA